MEADHLTPQGDLPPPGELDTDLHHLDSVLVFLQGNNDILINLAKVDQCRRLNILRSLGLIP